MPRRGDAEVLEIGGNQRAAVRFQLCNGRQHLGDSGGQFARQHLRGRIIDRAIHAVPLEGAGRITILARVLEAMWPPFCRLGLP
jgi:hypothetical protein